MKSKNYIRAGIKLLKVKYFYDSRGMFYEIYNKKKFSDKNIYDNFVQDSVSVSKKNVLRGLHYKVKKSQSQLLTILEGEIFDCVVDLRKSSKTYLSVFSFILNSKKNNQIYMPKGMAHGFCVLSNKAILHYNASQNYDPKNQNGIRWNDIDLDIKWPIKRPIISNRDNKFRSLAELIKLKLLPKL